MSTHNRDELNRAQLKQITGLARTLHETSEELYNFSTRRHPELHHATWLIHQTHKHVHEILRAFGEEV